jgi:hypothetical protein
MRDDERGQSGHRPHRPPRCRRSRDTTSDILLSRARLVESPRQIRN